MTRATLTLVVMLAALTTWALPLPDGLPDGMRGTTTTFAVGSTAVLVLLCGALLLGLRHSRRRQMGLLVSGIATLLALAALMWSLRTQQACTARYDGRPVLIGTTLTPNGAANVAAYPDLSRDDLLFDAAGDPALVWTQDSIARCRLLVAGTHALWVPWLGIALLGVAHALGTASLAGRHVPSHSSTPASPPPGTHHVPPRDMAPRYDAFISYRHGSPDADVAVRLLDALEREGYVVAFDARDFPANERFLAEMERCVRQSRFTLALVSARYLASGNCEEEAMICKVLDMSERRRRLVPLYLEPVEVPLWLHGIVGIQLSVPTGGVDPLEKLMATMGPPLTRITDAGR